MPGKARPKPAKPSRAKPAHKSVPKAEGPEAVHAFIALLPGWQADLGRRIDALITREVPGVRKAVKWHSAMYGVAGKGWFASMGGFKEYVKVNFFDGAQLKPALPGGESKTMRYIDLREDDVLDEAQMASWVKQAAKLPGWGKA